MSIINNYKEWSSKVFEQDQTAVSPEPTVESKANFTIEAMGGTSTKTGSALPGPYKHTVSLKSALVKDEATGDKIPSKVKSFVFVDNSATIFFNKNAPANTMVLQNAQEKWDSLDKYAKWAILGMILETENLNNFSAFNKYFQKLGLDSKEFTFEGNSQYAVDIYTGKKNVGGSLKIAKA